MDGYIDSWKDLYFLHATFQYFIINALFCSLVVCYALSTVLQLTDVLVFVCLSLHLLLCECSCFSLYFWL